MADGSHAFSSKKLSGDGGCPWLLGGSTLDCIHQAPGRQHADLRRILRDGGQSGPDMLCQAHAVISAQGQIFRNAKAQFACSLQGAQAGIIVGHQDASGRVWQT